MHRPAKPPILISAAIVACAVLLCGCGGGGNSGSSGTSANVLYKWAELGTGSASGQGISGNSGNSYYPAVAVTSLGLPVVAWADDTGGNYEIYVKKWNGTAWVEMGAGSASGGGISNNSGVSTHPSITIGGNGNPIVAWDDDTSGNQEIYVKRWNGIAWVEVGPASASGGGISNNGSVSEYPAIAKDAEGNPVVAWYDGAMGSREIYIRRWDGAWAEMGAGSASGGGLSKSSGDAVQPALANFTNGDLVIAWADTASGHGEIYVKKWSGGAWVEIGAGSSTGGGITNLQHDAAMPAITVDVSSKVIVAWVDSYTGNTEIYTKMWNGSQWKEMGAGSSTGGGISSSSGSSLSPSLATDGAGNTTLVWQDITSANYEIYAARWWYGAQWGLIGSQGTYSATGGISNNSGSSIAPRIASDSDGNLFVTWWDATSGNPEIYVKGIF